MILVTDFKIKKLIENVNFWTNYRTLTFLQIFAIHSSGITFLFLWKCVIISRNFCLAIYESSNHAHCIIFQVGTVGY